MRISDLQTKKIISISSGRNVGNIIDAIVSDNGMIESLIIEQNKNLFSFNRETDATILWNDIEKIGEDVILIKKD